MSNKTELTLNYNSGGYWQLVFKIEEQWINKDEAQERVGELVKEMIGHNIHIKVDV